MIQRFLLFWLLVITFVLPSAAQADSAANLTATILRLDSLLFQVGFNTCDIQQFETLLSDQFTFVHDKDGVSTKAQFLANFKNGLCKSPGTYQSRRELLKESTAIYPLYQQHVLYGAIQSGNHRFYEKIKDQPETYASSARFTHVWMLEAGVWKLAKGLSYDHQNTDKTHASLPIFDTDAAIEKWLKELRVPALGIGVIHNGQLQQVKVFGEQATGKAAAYNSLFNVASLTKPITAMVTLKLVSAGKWNLDEPLAKYWIDPDVANDPNHKKLTTRHILSHQTGFTNWRGNNADGLLRFGFEPGTKYQYSGEGFEYLRKALERKFKKSLPQLAAELIFNPLKMTDTQFFWDAQTDSTRMVVGYNSEGMAYPMVKNKTANAADDLITTVADYGKFMVALLQGGGLSPNVYQQMITHQVATKKDKYFGLGFELYEVGNGLQVLSHGGADKGCQTIVFLIPQTQEGLLVFTNVDDGYKVYEPLLQHYLGDLGKKIIEIEMR